MPFQATDLPQIHVPFVSHTDAGGTALGQLRPDGLSDVLAD